ncbi:conserved hypothetical protein [Lodderomyces elongisporus NRRL YB-4239]|uniref:glycogenin glucosyltransferase n=1 Tax=Lodderomyces elongisporus (strain ATCC 11503 / CBS 2605 / JCM 1781 / NBRC 1676 / NRRL YB-4239) TaxID=379508 RepID=A5DZB1_LODEL|nr:conserved hypothetical protein [Lodderomyces elongisporus NRRL YB-4239]
MSASNSAFVTLLVGESYAPGVLTLGSKLKELGTSHKLVLLLDTSTVSQELQDLISTVYDEIIPVDTIQAPLTKLAETLDRPELSITYTKLLLWGLTQYESIVYLDADVLPLQSLDNLFDSYEIGVGEIAASPDSGWPDIFNSGVFKLKPNQETLNSLIEFAGKGDSLTFDGADQGLLNEFYPNWHRLPYLYNVTPNYRQDYQYLPAFHRFFKDIKALHYIGGAKPWSYDNILSSDLSNFHQFWWDDFNRFFDKSTRYKLLRLKGEGANLRFQKLVNEWDVSNLKEPQQLQRASFASESVSDSGKHIEHPPIFPWEHRDKREATRFFHEGDDLPSYQDVTQDEEKDKDEAFHEKLRRNLDVLKATKLGSSSSPAPPRTKKAPLLKEYNFGQGDDDFNPDKSLDEVSKLPLKFFSKEKARRESEDK